MYHSINKSPKQDVSEQSSKESVGQQALSGDVILVPVRSGLYYEHDPQDDDGEHVECKSVQACQTEDTWNEKR